MKIAGDDEKLWMTNRDKRMAPKLGMFWCYCDLNIVWAWQKCEVCRKRFGKKRLKK